MDLALGGKNILVAASSRGLGFGVANALAEEGANVFLGSRNLEEAKSRAVELSKRFGTTISAGQLYAEEASSITSWAEQARSTFGSIHGLVVNAGGPSAGGFDDFSDADWQSAFELTLLSAIRMIREVLPDLKMVSSASILAITSTSIKEPIQNLILSNVFRAGVVSLVKSLSIEFAPWNIRVNNLVPGRIDTERVRALDEIISKKRGISEESQKDLEEQAIPLRRYGTVEEFGKAATFLLSDAASYITGATLLVDGGKTKTVW